MKYDMDFSAADHPIKRSGWFSSLFGFIEFDYETVKSNLSVEEDRNENKILTSKASKKRFLVGKFSTPSLSELRDLATSNEEVVKLKYADANLTLDFVYGDVSEIHANAEYRHATFQAASQFNCLEFIHPEITPEDGISVYAYDKTQGPACSIACGPATAYRNYFHAWTNAQGQAMVSHPPPCPSSVLSMTPRDRSSAASPGGPDQGQHDQQPRGATEAARARLRR